jgi:hypothetical protein
MPPCSPPRPYGGRVPPPLLILPDITQTDIAEIRAELGEIITITIVAGGSSSTRLSSPSLVSRRHIHRRKHPDPKASAPSCCWPVRGWCSSVTQTNATFTRTGLNMGGQAGAASLPGACDDGSGGVVASWWSPHDRRQSSIYFSYFCFLIAFR